MWYIYLKSSNLSDEAVDVCIQNNIHTLQQLIDVYISDNKFINVDVNNNEHRTELITFCNDVLQYFRTQIQIKEKRKVPNRLETEKRVLNNLTIQQLKDKGLISNRLYNSLKRNSVVDLRMIKKHYLEYNSFYDLNGIGEQTNNEAIQFIRSVVFNEVDQAVNNISNRMRFTEEKIDMSVLSNLLVMYEDLLKPKIVSYFINEIISLKDKKIVTEKLNTLIENPNTINGTGEKNIESLNNFLEDYYNICKNPLTRKEFEQRYFLYRCNLLVHDSFNFENIKDLDIEKPLEIIEFIIQNSKKLNVIDHYILENIGSAKIYNHSVGLKYIEASKELGEILNKDINVKSIKSSASRLKNKLSIIFKEIFKIIPELKLKMKELFPISSDIEFFNEELLDNVNENNNTTFHITFFDMLLSVIYEKDYLSVYNMSNKYFDFLCFINRKFIAPHGDFKKFIIDLRDILKSSNSIKNKFIEIEELLPTGVLIIDRHQFLTEFLKKINSDIIIGDTQVIFPPTRERKKGLVDLIESVLHEKGEAMHYDELVKEFDKKYPDFERTSNRSLKDAMDKSDIILSLGGLSNYYILAEWKDRYHVGSLKNIIKDYLQYSSAPVHYFELFKNFAPKRPGLTEKVINQVLIHFSDSIFKSHGEGFYSLRKNNIETEKRYTKIHTGLYDFINKHHELLNSPETLLDIMTNRYPGFERIQLEFVIYKLENQLHNNRAMVMN